jgi:predicted enzyme related to lactoylglutathione lyase
MTITLGYVTIDCADPKALGRFWSQALGWSITYEEDDGVVMSGTADASPQLFLQAVPESKSVKNRVHIDLGADDFAAELDRLVALGASVLRQPGDDTKPTAVLADPEGNEFCLAG